MIGLLISFSSGELVEISRIKGLPAPHPYAISADGKTVIGQFAPGNPFIWRGGSTRSFRPNSDKDVLDQYAQAVNGDGSIIVGKAGQAYLWSGGKCALLAGPKSFAYGVSGDGRTVVGQIDGNKTTRGFVWTKDAGATFISEFSPTNVSADGKVVVGIFNNKGVTSAHRWVAGKAEVLSVPENTTDSAAFAANKSGSKIVGSVIFGDEGTQAALWKDGVFNSLDNSGMREAVAKCITPDGSLIGGYAGDQAAIWTSDGKVTFLEMALRQASVSTRGWSLESVNGIARVGSTVYVTGWAHRNGKDAGYRASIRIRS